MSAWMSAGAEAWSKGLEAWSQMLGQYTQAAEQKDRRFASPEWREDPIFDTVRQSYLAISDKLLGTVEEIDGLDEPARKRLRFATQGDFLTPTCPRCFIKMINVVPPPRALASSPCLASNSMASSTERGCSNSNERIVINGL